MWFQPRHQAPVVLRKSLEIERAVQGNHAGVSPRSLNRREIHERGRARIPLKKLNRFRAPSGRIRSLHKDSSAEQLQIFRVSRRAGRSEHTELVGLVGVRASHERCRSDLGVNLGEHQMGERSLQLILVGGATNRSAGRSLKEPLQGTFGDTNRHSPHEAERPPKRWRLPKRPLEAVVERSAENLLEVDTAVIGNEELVSDQLYRNTARAAHAGYLPVIKKPKLIQRNLHAHEMGPLPIVGNASEAREGRPQRVTAKSPRTTRNEPATPDALGAAAGGWKVARAGNPLPPPLWFPDLLQR